MDGLMSSSRVFLLVLAVASLSVTLLGFVKRDASVANAANRSTPTSKITPAPVRLPVEPYESDGTVGAVGSEGGYWALVADAVER